MSVLQNVAYFTYTHIRVGAYIINFMQTMGLRSLEIESQLRSVHLGLDQASTLATLHEYVHFCLIQPQFLHGFTS